MQPKQLLTLLSVFLIALFASPACSGGGDSSDSDPSVPEGDEDFVPPSSDDGSGQQPSGATSVTCEDAADCAYWFCECDDGAIVNTANCSNGFCLDAPSTCPTACEYFEHGSWTGAVGGGPNTQPDDPQPDTCGSQGSTPDTCWSCVESECCAESATCYGNVDCLNYWDCRYFCEANDPDCAYECEVLNPYGVDDYNNLESCLLGSCSQDC